MSDAERRSMERAVALDPADGDALERLDAHLVRTGEHRLTRRRALHADLAAALERLWLRQFVGIDVNGIFFEGAFRRDGDAYLPMPIFSEEHHGFALGQFDVVYVWQGNGERVHHPAFAVDDYY